MAEGGFAAGSDAHGVEGGIGTVDFHLIDDAQEAAEFAARPAVPDEPLQVFGGEVVNRDAARREMIGAEFAEWHVHAGNVREVRGHVIGQEIFHAGDSVAPGRGAVNGRRY